MMINHRHKGMRCADQHGLFRQDCSKCSIYVNTESTNASKMFTSGCYIVCLSLHVLRPGCSFYLRLTVSRFRKERLQLSPPMTYSSSLTLYTLSPVPVCRTQQPPLRCISETFASSWFTQYDIDMTNHGPRIRKSSARTIVRYVHIQAWKLLIRQFYDINLLRRYLRGDPAMLENVYKY